MTVRKCRNHCRRLDVQLACLYNGNTCLCRNTIDDYDRCGDEYCNSECTGQGNETCGSLNTISVYNVSSGICDDPLNGSDIYYYGDIFANCPLGLELTGAQSIQCVMGESERDMKWSDDFPECKVSSGICDDPLNGSDIYYYGDIFANFTGPPGHQLTGAKSIQCVMGDSERDMKWRDNFPECKEFLSTQPTSTSDDKYDIDSPTSTNTQPIIIAMAAELGVGVTITALIAILMYYKRKKKPEPAIRLYSYSTYLPPTAHDANNPEEPQYENTGIEMMRHSNNPVYDEIPPAIGL
ncbi:uncharacterized protein [Amphiura filiformis]|uniref:uncharacterized protein n=1 Tax=Amphiura filiformis TaxID=82378 RepID=UPI003B21AB75